MSAEAPVRLSRFDLLRIAAGALFLQAAWSPERRQAPGFAAALAPVARLWTRREDRSAFLRRHLENFNTNPAMAGPILGAVARLEERAAGGDAAARDRVNRFKKGVESPFAALGDELLWKGFRAGGAVWGSAIAWLAGPAGPLVFLGLYNLLHLGLRMGGVFWGYAHGEQTHRILRSPLLGGLRRFAPIFSAVGLMAAIAVFGGATEPERGPLLLGFACAAAGALAGARGIVHGTPVALGAIIIGLIAALRLG